MTDSNPDPSENKGPNSLFSLGHQFLSALQNLPKEVRIFALVVLVFAGPFAYFIATGSSDERRVALYAVIFFIAAAILFAFFLAFAISRGTKTAVKEQLRDKIILEAPKQSADTSNGKPTKYEYDVFFSAQMASQDDAVRKEYNAQVINIVDAVKQTCQFTAFYAGYKRDHASDDDLPAIALRDNVHRMRASQYFILIYTQYEPTSALIELGMALGLGKPSVWFVKKGVRLPYLMRGYQAGGSNGLPPIKLYEIESLDDISNKIKLHGTALFEN